MNTKKIPSAVPAVICGVCIGVAVTFVLQPMMRLQDERVPRADVLQSYGAAAAPASPTDDGRLALQRLQALEARVAGMMEANEATDGHGDGPAPEKDAPAEPLSRTAVESAWSARLAQHEHEAVSPEWSARWASRIEQDLDALRAGTDIPMGAVDCRSATCVVPIEWPSYAKALEQYDALLNHAYDSRCIHGTILPEPEDRDAPYTASFIFSNCEEQAAL